MTSKPPASKKFFDQVARATRGKPRKSETDGAVAASQVDRVVALDQTAHNPLRPTKMPGDFVTGRAGINAYGLPRLLQRLEPLPRILGEMIDRRDQQVGERLG